MWIECTGINKKYIATVSVRVQYTVQYRYIKRDELRENRVGVGMGTMHGGSCTIELFFKKKSG